MAQNNASRFDHDNAKNIPIGIPPNLLKNFNSFTILEPQKVNVNSPTTNDALLIDLDEPGQSSAQIQKGTTQENTGFDLIDVFQNILVTPDLVTRKTIKNEPKPEINIDQEDFLRKLELGKKFDWSQNSSTLSVKEKEQYQLDFEQTFDRVVENQTGFKQEKITNNYVAPDYEDLIEELLPSNNTLKTKISNTLDSTQNIRVLKTPVLQNDALNNLTKKTDINEKDNGNVAQGNTMSFDTADHILKFKNPRVLEKQEDCLNSASNSFNYDEPWQLLQNLRIDSPTFVEVTSTGQDTEPQKTHFKRNNITNDINFLRETDMKNVTKDTIFNKTMLDNTHHILDEPVKLSPKSKNNNTTPFDSKLDDAMVSNFLKAMDCEDFKLNSPRNKQHPIDSPLKNNITDTSPLKYSETGKKNIVSSSKNKNDIERILSELKPMVRRANQNNSAFCSDTFALIGATVDPALLIIPVKPIVKDSKAFNKYRSVKSDAEMRTYTKGPDLKEKMIMLPQLLNRLSLDRRADKNVLQRRIVLDSQQSSKATNKKEVDIPITLEPTVLMEDCNKERLKALKTRQMLHKFVKNGHLLD